MSHIHHSVDYVELTVPDVAAARAFYAEALGWSFTDFGPDYASFNRSDDDPLDGEAGGLAKGTPAPAAPGAPAVILWSDDLDATHAAITKAGGAVEEPYEFPGGRRFFFTDPAGNRLACWTT